MSYRHKSLPLDPTRPACFALLRLLPLPVLIVLFLCSAAGLAQEAKSPPRELPFPPGENWLRVTRDFEVWIDPKAKQVLVGGRTCLREGLLEMFACPRGTKEHEAVVSVNTPARYVHGGLMAVGAQPGRPVQFQPEYKPAEGIEVEVTVIWKDVKGEEHRTKAQDWVKNTKTGQALAYPWVFAGSGFWVDEEAGERFYYADGGEFICVSNFATAMLDLPVESSDANDTLLFSAFTERIPPLETRVFLLLTPKLKKQDDAPPKKTDAADPGSKESAKADGGAKETPEAKQDTGAEAKKNEKNGQPDPKAVRAAKGDKRP